MNFKTFRFQVIINNVVPGIIIEQRALNINDATRALQAIYKGARIIFFGMGKD